MDQLAEHMDDDRLKDSDREILAVLRDHDGHLPKGAIVDATGLSENTVYNRTDSLVGAGVLELKHERTRLFAIAEDPETGETYDVDVIESDE